MIDQLTYQQGVMEKDPRSMNPAERRAWQRQGTDEARAYLFSINQPLVYVRADGRAEIIR